MAEGLDLPVSQVQDALQHLQERGLIQVFPLGYLHREAFKSWQSRTLSVLQEYHKSGPCGSACPSLSGGSRCALVKGRKGALAAVIISKGLPFVTEVYCG